MHNSTSWVTWYENSRAFILRQVGPKACAPEHLNTADVIKETLITLIVATEGGTERVFLCTTVCLGQRMLQVKIQGCHCLCHALKTTWSGTKRHRENDHWRGILSPLNGLGFVSSGIKELITEAEFLKWQPCPVRTSLLWCGPTHSDSTQPSVNSFQLWPSLTITL